MQTLVFNTKTKNVTLYSEKPGSTILANFSDVPTVKVMESYYEVIQKQTDDNGVENRIPVARFPISNTNMFIQS
jgi:hypothetical protein